MSRWALTVHDTCEVALLSKLVGHAPELCVHRLYASESRFVSYPISCTGPVSDYRSHVCRERGPLFWVGHWGTLRGGRVKSVNQDLLSDGGAG